MNSNDPKMRAGWFAMYFSMFLAVAAVVGRWFPNLTAQGTEAPVISAYLAFAAAAFGISVYERRGQLREDPEKEAKKKK